MGSKWIGKEEENVRKKEREKSGWRKKEGPA